MMLPKLLITHTDLDGVACAVLARLAYGDLVDVRFARNPDEATNILVVLAESEEWKKYSQILLTDISFFPERLLSKARNDAMFSVLRLFDHHKTSALAFINYHWATFRFEIDGKSTCGAELFQEYLVRKGLIQPRPFFVELVRQYDTWDWQKNGNETAFFLNQLCFALGFSKFIESFAEKLERHDVSFLTVFDEKERFLLEVTAARKQDDEARLLEQVRIVATPEYEFGVVFVGNGDVSSLGNHICQRYGVDIACMIDANTGKISVRTIRDDLDLGKIMQEYFGDKAGGHRKAAGGTIEPDLLERFLCSVFVRFGNSCEVLPRG